jgi:hypothetical protein
MRACVDEHTFMLYTSSDQVQVPNSPTYGTLTQTQGADARISKIEVKRVDVHAQETTTFFRMVFHLRVKEVSALKDFQTKCPCHINEIFFLNRPGPGL